MTTDPLEIIKFDFLYRKSSDCIKRALHRKSTEGPYFSDSSRLDLFGQEATVNIKEYQLWAAIALELLGKAALARHHPCFVVDPRGSDSILAAAGIGLRHDGTRIKMEGIRTISATEVYKRLRNFIPDYGDDAYSLCLTTAANRNAEIHTAAITFFSLEPSWEEKYWNTCKIILSHIEYSFNDWLGEENAAEALHVIEEASKARAKKKSDVAVQIAMAGKNFNKLSEAVRNAIVNKLENIDLITESNSIMGPHEKVWEVTCPACGNRSFMAGHETILSIVTTTDLVDGERRRVKDSGRIFAPSVFKCIACDLKLTDSDEIRFANMYKTYQD